MIRKQQNGYEHFECFKCGEHVDQFDDYCQICGHTFSEIKNEITYTNNFDSDDENDTTMCIVVSAQNSGIFIFTELKVDKTPRNLLALPQFQHQRLFSEPSNEFYVFKRELHNIYVGQQLDLEMDNYEHFITPNFVKIYYNKNEFNLYDIRELKTYNFNQ